MPVYLLACEDNLDTGGFPGEVTPGSRGEGTGQVIQGRGEANVRGVISVVLSSASSSKNLLVQTASSIVPWRMEEGKTFV